MVNTAFRRDRIGFPYSGWLRRMVNECCQWLRKAFGDSVYFHLYSGCQSIRSPQGTHASKELLTNNRFAGPIGWESETCDRINHFLSKPLALCRNGRSEEHTSELQSLRHLVCRL